MIKYSSINHQFRKENNMPVVQYLLADIISFSAKNIKGDGWCNMSKQELSEYIGSTRRSVINHLNDLEINGFIERNEDGTKLKSTEKWERVYYFEGVKNFHTPVKKLHTTCEKFSHTNNKEINIIYNRELESKFLHYDIMSPLLSSLKQKSINLSEEKYKKYVREFLIELHGTGEDNQHINKVRPHFFHWVKKKETGNSRQFSQSIDNPAFKKYDTDE